MPQYYILKPAIDTQETGHAFPAVESYDDYNFKGLNSVHKLNSREFPNFVPDIRFKLAMGANLCDMMGQATINAKGFLVSEKLKSIIEHANTVPCRFYNATIEAKGDLHNYYWVHFVWEEGKHFVDYERSDFFAKRLSKNLGKVNVTCEEDIMLRRNEFDVATIIDFNEITLVNINLDLFVINYFTTIYISDSFYQRLSNENISGIQTEKASKIKFL
ncbi:MAG: hypothetical protein IPM74_11975 [Crocinitomicaceae bacterium]|nr:hypothetical protein [Crocinitomicaceae bacterium]MBK8926592.1 hypothetical protein [Crocinitomicaceae bacterium]